MMLNKDGSNWNDIQLANGPDDPLEKLYGKCSCYCVFSEMGIEECKHYHYNGDFNIEYCDEMDEFDCIGEFKFDSCYNC